MNAVKEIATYCGSITTILALITIVIKPIRKKFIGWISKTSDKDNLNKKIDKLTVLVEKQVEQNKSMETELQKQSLALQATLRNSILVIYNSRMKENSISLYEKENLARLYESYSSIGGNSFIHNCVNELNQLPVKED